MTQNESLHIGGTSAPMDRLRRFNELVDEWAGFSFNELLGSRVRAEIQWQADTAEATIRFTGATREAVVAITPLVRFLTEDGTDRLSIRSLSDAYEQESVPPRIKERFRQIRDQLNALLDAPGVFSLGGAPPLTARVLLEDYVYGVALHRDPSRRGRLARFLDDPFAGPFLQCDLQHAFSIVVAAGRALMTLNLEAIEFLCGTTA